MRLVLFAVVLVAAGGVLGCAPGDEVPLGEAGAAVSQPGPWAIPASTVAIGDTQYVNYTPAGPWVGESGCYGSLTPGTAILRRFLLDHFPGISSIGGYRCLPGVANPDRMGIHGTGRAIDVMIPRYDGDADNDLGDPIGNFLIEHAQLIGVQYIIWDRIDWVGSHSPGDKVGDYTGSTNPHTDHLHVEMSVETSENDTPWFEDALPAPQFPVCTIAVAGGVVDDAEPCVPRFGSAAYWRTEATVGYGGGLHWTNAYDSPSEGNWAMWNLSFEAANRYLLEVYLEPAFAIASHVRYEVTHGGGVDTLYLDQSAGAGWVALGTFDFAAGAGQLVALYDDQVGVASNQHIALDALRLTGQGLPPSTPDAARAAADAALVPNAPDAGLAPGTLDAAAATVDAGGAGIEDEETYAGEFLGSCATGPGASARGARARWTWILAAALAGLAARRRRRRRRP